MGFAPIADVFFCRFRPETGGDRVRVKRRVVGKNPSKPDSP